MCFIYFLFLPSGVSAALLLLKQMAIFSRADFEGDMSTQQNESAESFRNDCFTRAVWSYNEDAFSEDVMQRNNSFP